MAVLCTRVQYGMRTHIVLILPGKEKRCHVMLQRDSCTCLQFHPAALSAVLSMNCHLASENESERGLTAGKDSVQNSPCHTHLQPNSELNREKVLQTNVREQFDEVRLEPPAVKGDACWFDLGMGTTSDGTASKMGGKGSDL